MPRVGIGTPNGARFVGPILNMQRAMKIEIYDGDDWKVLVVDGKRVDAGHDVDLESVLTNLGHEVTTRYGTFGRFENDISDGDDSFFTTEDDEELNVP
jgi:hypothetical protein